MELDNKSILPLQEKTNWSWWLQACDNRNIHEWTEPEGRQSLFLKSVPYENMKNQNNKINWNKNYWL